MPLTRLTYDIWLNTPGRELTTDTPPDHTVLVNSGDQLRAELEAKRLGIPPMREAPLNATALWIWAAMARQGLTELPAVAFMADVPEFEPVRDAAGEPQATEVDPTKLAAGALASGSPGSMESPATG